MGKEISVDAVVLYPIFIEPPVLPKADPHCTNGLAYIEETVHHKFCQTTEDTLPPGPTTWSLHFPAQEISCFNS